MTRYDGRLTCVGRGARQPADDPPPQTEAPDAGSGVRPQTGAAYGPSELPAGDRESGAAGTGTHRAPPSAEPAAGGRSPSGTGAPRRPADPVRELMHRHRGLCARAVDPLEIAAGLEAHGVTDRTAARFRHRDVFSLAEELFARVPRSEDRRAPREFPPGPHHLAPRVRGAVVALLPGALCTVTLTALTLGAGAPAPARIVVAVAGTTAAGLCVRAALRRLSRAAPAVLLTLSACWLTAYALFGEWLHGRLLGPAAWSPAPAGAVDAAVPLTLAFAVAPAVWAVRGFGLQARRRLAASHGLAGFAAGVRPLLAVTVAGFAAVLAGTQAAVRAALGGGPQPPDTGLLALGVLLFTALLLTVHGFESAAFLGLGVASLAEAGALACAVAARQTGGRAEGWTAAATAVSGTGLVPAAVCGLTAAALLAYAFRTLTGASAHHRQPAC